METYLEFYNRVKQKQSETPYAEFMRSKPPELYRELLTSKGYVMEVWEFKINLKNAFSMGYRLKKTGNAKELLLQQAYRMYKSGELLSEKYPDQN